MLKIDLKTNHLFNLFVVPPCAHKQEGFGEDQLEIHRHKQQVWTRSLPDPPGKEGIHGKIPNLFHSFHEALANKCKTALLSDLISFDSKCEIRQF